MSYESERRAVELAEEARDAAWAERMAVGAMEYGKVSCSHRAIRFGRCADCNKPTVCDMCGAESPSSFECRGGLSVRCLECRLSPPSASGFGDWFGAGQNSVRQQQLNAQALSTNPEPVHRCMVPSCGEVAVWSQPDRNVKGGVARLCLACAQKLEPSMPVEPTTEQSLARADDWERLAQTEREGRMYSQDRANRLADECGSLRAERDELLRENGALRRTVEKLERKAKR